MILRRLGGSEASLCTGGHHCPQFLESDDGNILVVGEDITAAAIPSMPPGPGVGPNERVVRVPRQVFTAAARAETAAA